MTIQETQSKMREFAREKQALEEKIVDAARAVVPVLLDAGRTNSAKALQELLFEHDARRQEFAAFIDSDPRLAMEAILRGLTDRA